MLEVEDLRLDLGTLEASRAGQPLHLYPACRKLLETLMQASPAAVSRERLEHALWGDNPPDGDMLRSHIYELRRSVDGPFRGEADPYPAAGRLSPGRDHPWRIALERVGRCSRDRILRWLFAYAVLLSAAVPGQLAM